MSNLSVEFAGLKLKNPFIVASSELTNTLEKIKLAEEAGASAVSTKLCFLNVPFWAKPYHIVEKGNAFFSPSGDRLSVEQAQKLIDGCKKETKLKIIANMMGPGEDLKGWGTLAKKLEDAGADMIEMNMSCPNVGLMAKQLNIEAPPELGASLGQNPALAKEVTKAVTSSVKIPVMAKMTPDGNTPMVSKACAEGGAAAVSAINCPQSLPGVDIYHDGRPLYPNTTNHSFAGLCGPWIRPLAYRHIAQIRMQNPTLPIAGGGGLMTWKHVVDMIMYGADVTTFCVLFYLKGYRVIRSFEEKILKFMEAQGYSTIEDFRGIALKHIVTPDKVHYYNAVPQIDKEKCTGCNTCVNMSHCMIFEAGDKVPKVTRTEECYGCGVCYWTCPQKAISMKNTDTGEVTNPPA